MANNELKKVMKQKLELEIKQGTINFEAKKSYYDISDQAQVYCNRDLIGDVWSDKEGSYYNAVVIFDANNFVQNIEHGKSLKDGIKWIIWQYKNKLLTDRIIAELQ